MTKAKRIPKTRLAEYRRDALSMFAEGFSPQQIANRLHCGRSTIFGWLAQEKAGTLPAEPGMGSGRPPKLTEAQTAKLYRMLFRRPDQYEFDFGLWTRTMVAELIERTFGVAMSVSAVGRMLRNRMGMSPQRPLHQAVERNPVAVARWKAEEFPAIARRARAEGATIWWQDESGVRTDYHSGTTWAPIGQTPVVIAFLATTTKGRLEMFFLPGYSPTSTPTNGSARTSSATRSAKHESSVPQNCPTSSCAP
ncbi:MAG: IS630 family transposase [Mycobacteriales bacterium]